jgi:hypothetical protein
MTLNNGGKIVKLLCGLEGNDFAFNTRVQTVTWGFTNCTRLFVVYEMY